MATRREIQSLIKQFQDADAMLAAMGDREVTYSTRGGTRTEPAADARVRVVDSIAFVQRQNPGDISSADIAEFSQWVDRLVSEIEEAASGPTRFSYAAAILTGIVALGIAAFIS